MYLFHSSKGGNGTTLVTVACALAEVAQRPRAVLVDLCGDVPAVLGMAEPVGPGVNDWLAENSTADTDTLLHCGTTVADGLLVVHRGAEHVEGSPRWALLAATLATLPVPVFVDAHRGQSTVEFALLLPLVVMCVALILLVVAVTQAQLTVVNASRNAVRSAIMHNHSAADTAGAARSAAHDTSPLRPLHVDVTAHDDFLTVTVSAKWGFPVPVLGAWLPRITLKSSSTMLRETTGDSP